MNEDTDQPEDSRTEAFRGFAWDVFIGAVTSPPTGVSPEQLLPTFMGGIAVPLLSRSAPLAAQELRYRGVRREFLLNVALSDANDRAEALAQAAANPDHVFLLEVAGDAAEHTRSVEKLIALGRAVHRGLRADDAATFDYELMLVQAMDRIERPHLTILAELTTREDHGPTSAFQPKDLDWSQLRTVAGPYRSALVPILADLEKAGLIHSEKFVFDGGDLGGDSPPKSPLDGKYWEASEFGCAVLAEFHIIGVRAGLLRG